MAVVCTVQSAFLDGIRIIIFAIRQVQKSGGVIPSYK